MKTAVVLLICVLGVCFGYPRNCAQPGYEITFPKDHGRHDQLSAEWWYWTGVLESTEGHKLGFETTVFKLNVDLIKNTTIHGTGYRGDCTFTDITNDKFLSFNSLGTQPVAHAKNDQLYIRFGDWRIQQNPNDPTDYTLKASLPNHGVRYSFKFEDVMGNVLEADNGYERTLTSSDCGSYYYSQPMLKTSGQIQVGVGPKHTIYTLNPEKSYTWMDHQFLGFDSVGGDKSVKGWDWMSVRFVEHGLVFLLNNYYRDIHNFDASVLDEFAFINIHTPKASQFLPFKTTDIQVQASGFKLGKKSKLMFPTEFIWTIPSIDLTLNIRGLNADAELTSPPPTKYISYWESPAAISGKYGDMELSGGTGFIEIARWTK